MSTTNLGVYIIFTDHHFSATSSWSVFEESFSNQEIPDNTSDAVNQGCHKLLQAGIRDICQSARNEMRGSVKIIITGGNAKAILNYPDMPLMQHEPDLVMQGLYNIMVQQGNEVGV